METAIYLEPPAVEARLAELGLTTEMLQEAVEYGQLHWSSCTNHDPVSLPGILAWGKTMKRLRDILIPLGWSAVNDRNLPSVVDPSQKISIVVTTGDEGTGVASLAVRTKYRKGPATAAIIIKNGEQLSLFGQGNQVVPIKKCDPDSVTWVLLVARTENEVRCELSLPTRFDYSGHVGDCIERILLPPISLDGDKVELPVDDSADNIDIKISKRG
jgi:hypothetical protein